MTKEKLVKKDGELNIVDHMTEAQSIVDLNDSVASALSKIEKTRDPRIMVVDKKPSAIGFPSKATKTGVKNI